MQKTEPVLVFDLTAFVKLVEQDRVDVAWSVLSEIGPEWIGSRRKIDFFVDGMPMAQNALTHRLVQALIDELALPATSIDHVISGEGHLRRKGRSIEVVYDWTKAVPYDDPVKSGSGVFTLVKDIAQR